MNPQPPALVLHEFTPRGMKAPRALRVWSSCEVRGDGFVLEAAAPARLCRGMEVPELVAAGTVPPPCPAPLLQVRLCVLLPDVTSVRHSVCSRET